MGPLFWLLLAAFLIVLVPWRRDRKAQFRQASDQALLFNNLQSALTRQETNYQHVVEWLLRLLKAEPKAVADTLIDAVAALSGAESALVLTQDPERLDWIPRAARGLAPESLETLRIVSFDGAPQKSGLETVMGGSPYTVPLKANGRTVGCLVIARPANGSLPRDHDRLISLVADQAARIMGHEDLSKRYQGSLEQTVHMLSRAVEAKDPSTASHQKRTMVLARSLAEELRLPEYWVCYIEQGALLHDVGKIGVPESLLRKPGPLTAEEYEFVKHHPAIGRGILEPSLALRPVTTIVYSHHEWYNGQGYPGGLAGTEIPLGARLVQIVDAWDAMTSDRPYRNAMPKSAAIAEIRRCSGTQFDPKMVDTFLKLLERLEREGVATTEAQPPASAECR